MSERDHPDVEIDAIVVGGGPAGLSAATWLARYRVPTLLLDGAEQRNRVTERVHGYLGIDPCAPDRLLEIARAAVNGYEEVMLETGTIASVERASEGAFLLRTGDGRRIRAQRIVLATGISDVLPSAAGFEEHYGTSVFHCSSCDGYEWRDRPIAILGATPAAAGYTLELRRWSEQLFVVLDDPSGTIDLTDARTELDRHGIEVVNGPVARFRGARGAFEGLELADGTVRACEAVFFSLGHLPRTGLAVELGCRLDDEGYIEIDHTGATSVEGVYAAGDCTPGTQLVQFAAAQGTAAGIACARSLEPRATSSRR